MNPLRQEEDMIIDFHTHIFPDKIASRTLEVLSEAGGIPFYTDGTASGLASSMQSADITLSVNLPVMTSPQQVHKVNDSLLAFRDSHRKLGILSFAGMHPDYEDYKQELKLRKSQGFSGIKLHPAYQRCDLDDIRYMRIIDCACSLGLCVLTHAGEDIGIPGHNYADTGMILNVIDKVHPEGLILAHMGGWNGWDDVEKYLAGAPVYFDTAFSINEHGMNTEDFIRLCRKHGTGRILFGSDCPWSCQQKYTEAFRNMPFTEQELQTVFEGNALRLITIEE